MFEKEKSLIEKKIINIFINAGIQYAPVIWSWIPFSGHWGISTSFFKTAASNPNIFPEQNVTKRAELIAQLVTEQIELPDDFIKIESVKGYLNLYFDTNEDSQRIIESILDAGKDYGKGKETGKRIMVEYSQPNTHKSFHVGHLRNMVLGSYILPLSAYKNRKPIPYCIGALR